MWMDENRMEAEAAEAWLPFWAVGMIEQRLVQLKTLAAVIGAEHRGGIDACQHHVGPERGGGLERPDRIKRYAAAGGEFDIAFGGFGPARAKIVRATDHSAPGFPPVAGDN